MRNDAGHLSWKRNDGVHRTSGYGHYCFSREGYVSELPPLEAAPVVILVVLGNDGSFERLPPQDLEFDQVEVDRVARYS